MNPVQSFVQNPVKVTVGALLVGLFGTIAMLEMPKQLTPEVERPVVLIRTRWPGASPQEIEREIVLEQEEQLKSVEGMIKMSSDCNDSRSSVELEFSVGTNIQQAIVQVSSRLQQVRDYPIDADLPVIETRSSSDNAIARLVLSPRPPSREKVVEFAKAHPEIGDAFNPVLSAANPALMVYRIKQLYKQVGDKHPSLEEIMPPDINIMQMRRFTEDEVEARLERVPGVADAYIYGGLQEELQVVVKP